MYVMRCYEMKVCTDFINDVKEKYLKNNHILTPLKLFKNSLFYAQYNIADDINFCEHPQTHCFPFI